MPLMLASCNPHPNWMPMNPKLMFQICQKLRRGFSAMRLSSGLSRVDVDVFEHDVAVERERVQQRLRHVRDVDEAGPGLCVRGGVLHVHEAGAVVEDADV